MRNVETGFHYIDPSDGCRSGADCAQDGCIVDGARDRCSTDFPGCPP